MKIALAYSWSKIFSPTAVHWKKNQFVLQSLDERLKNVHTFNFVFPTFLAGCESIQHPQTLTTGDLSPYKQNNATRFCTSCVFIQYNNTGIKCNKKVVVFETCSENYLGWRNNCHTSHTVQKGIWVPAATSCILCITTKHDMPETTMQEPHNSQ